MMKTKLYIIRKWIDKQMFPGKIIFLISGIISTLWFLFRVIPKPSRATYPCMKVTAPVMSGFVAYLIALGSIATALRKVRQNIFSARYVVAAIFLFTAMAGMVYILTNGIQDTYALNPMLTGPIDGPNMPVGNGIGSNPGRVVWVWDPDATNENCTNNFDNKDLIWQPENTNEKVVGQMFRDGLKKLTGKTEITESWNVLFHYHNNKKLLKDKGYTSGEKIFIKINQNMSKGLLNKEDMNNGFYYPATLLPNENRGNFMGSAEAGPYIVLEILRQLVNQVGINQSDIAVGDPIGHIYGHNYDAWSKEFPGVLYIDRLTNKFGRTLVFPTKEDLVYYSDKTQKDKLYDIIENASYLINLANFKPHTHAGISLTAKNHYGSHANISAEHLHYSLIAPFGGNKATNGGYRKYRGLVDLMGSKYLGQNTFLFIVDGLFGGGSNQSLKAVKYNMAPFNNDWSNSIFLSQDQVAIESVCFDFLRTEWNGINMHDPVNNRLEAMPNAEGVDDYLHQAADPANWPTGIIYDPDNSGNPLSSLGVHEHWNSAEKMQYSGNLGLAGGIELISIPESLVLSENKNRKKN